MATADPSTVRALAKAAAQPGGIAVLTGAGMSAESGIPTFRDALTGHWSRFDPMELASDEGFRAHPQRVWDWYAERRAGVRAAAPNAGHRALAAFAARHPGVMTVITQNVDDLHQRAGQPAVLRLHGDILEDRWLEPCPRRAAHLGAWAAEGDDLLPPTLLSGCDASAAQPGRPPHCEACGNQVRPGVVWFGEALPVAALAAAEAAVDAAQVLVVVGTSGVVWPAAGLAACARRGGATVLIVNPMPSEIDAEAHCCIAATAAITLPALFDSL